MSRLISGRNSVGATILEWHLARIIREHHSFPVPFQFFGRCNSSSIYHMDWSSLRKGLSLTTSRGYQCDGRQTSFSTLKLCRTKSRYLSYKSCSPIFFHLQDIRKEHEDLRSSAAPCVINHFTCVECHSRTTDSEESRSTYLHIRRWNEFCILHQDFWPVMISRMKAIHIDKDQKALFNGMGVVRATCGQ